ncbi:protein IQ-DOMAIN 2-like isoform X2 [Diospyros lotus]|uniref:protein IQ-DOMAIN 2-like isoform X2 n=1 Tax=Diospyros lotus TaxID=55363 RepID=UPI0022561281|nr:protein IQ-DOMAIN 2-like isoform X2 [Diospyros lotus]
MGKRGSWIVAVKKALTSDPEKKSNGGSNRKWFGRNTSLDSASSPAEIAVPVPEIPPTQDEKLVEDDNEQSKHACSIANVKSAIDEHEHCKYACSIADVKFTEDEKYACSIADAKFAEDENEHCKHGCSIFYAKSTSNKNEEGKDVDYVANSESKVDENDQSKYACYIADMKSMDDENDKSKHTYPVANVEPTIDESGGSSHAYSVANVEPMVDENGEGKLAYLVANAESTEGEKEQTRHVYPVTNVESRVDDNEQGKHGFCDVDVKSKEDENELNKHDFSIGDANSIEDENEQIEPACSLVLATGVAAETAVACGQTDAEVVRVITVASYSGKSKEESAAIKIQAVFQGYLARKKVRLLRGLARLKSLTQGHSVKRQAANALRCMQNLTRVQSQIRARRIRMSEENQALQRQIQQKHEKELEKSREPLGGTWNDSTQSKEQIKAKLQHRKEAAMRREKALAYASLSQKAQKKNSKSANPPVMDINSSQWGWSWLDRWMDARPWENTAEDNTEFNTRNPTISSGGLKRANSLHELNLGNKLSPKSPKPNCIPARKSASAPRSKAPSPIAKKTRSPSSRGTVSSGEDEARSNRSSRSDQLRRHSVAGLSVGNGESPVNSPSVKGKSKQPGQLGSGTPEKGSAKKRFSFPSPPVAGTRRHSGPAKLAVGSAKDINVSS